MALKDLRIIIKYPNKVMEAGSLLTKDGLENRKSWVFFFPLKQSKSYLDEQAGSHR